MKQCVGLFISSCFALLILRQVFCLGALTPCILVHSVCCANSTCFVNLKLCSSNFIVLEENEIDTMFVYVTNYKFRL